MMRHKWLTPACIAALLIFGAAVYGRLPEQVPSHWNMYGQVDGTTGRLGAVLMLPAIATGVWLLMLVLPQIDPHRAAYASFAGTYQLILNTVVLFLALVQVALLGVAIGWPIGMPQVLGVGVGLLFMVLGNEMGRLKPNWFAGIRTPWTLSDPENWRRTHRFGGKVFFVAGLLIALSSLLLPSAMNAFVILAGALSAAVLSIGYSYMFWRQHSGT
jgi:uncharacterized membrane protein